MTSLRGFHPGLHTQSQCHVHHLCKPLHFGWNGPSWHCVPKDRQQSIFCSCEPQLAGIPATPAIEHAMPDENVTDQEGLQRREIERLLSVLPADLQLAIVSTGSLWQVCELICTDARAGATCGHPLRVHSLTCDPAAGTVHVLFQSRSCLCRALAQQSAFYVLPLASAHACCVLQLARRITSPLPSAPAHPYVVRCSLLKWSWIWAGPRLPGSPAAMLC